ncbi:hypothetical protein IW140_005188 [Coemansia sp. RSA 1813]|nr:hypothetical protein EV178_003779 [Coemansia sp. RSA 1646]KAJ1769705.1 hypothetical protein LPJ74_003794 [Coemansia sp. RSA 1843]KAJ2089019.1 hypothetical protein IW138_003731 [Coemansia sp. RSA 986]KAJ2213488.1 hypothetical protein EV179_003807 [Coemansia sp. RSA 487]KAJ2565846.1 hypothetical protein IW140_005188 [Coemansia sp. RSA 1813]
MQKYKEHQQQKAASIKHVLSKAPVKYSKSTRSTSTANSSSIDEEDERTSSGVSSTMLEYEAASAPPPPLPASGGGSSRRTSDDFICAQLDQMGRRRLDSQCAQLRPPRQPSKQVDLGEILFRANKLTANRMRNQDFTPQRVRRIESLHRIAGSIGSSSSPSSSTSPLGGDAHGSNHVELSPQRTRELFLTNIAARLRKADALGDTNLADQQPAVHPREQMRNFLVNAIGRLKQMDDPAMDAHQRFHKQSPATSASQCA